MYNYNVFCTNIYGKRIGDKMVFRIERKEYVNKTFRFERKLVERMEKICDAKNISMNQLVVESVGYALNDMAEDDDKILNLNK